jgi:hypothetical protein
MIVARRWFSRQIIQGADQHDRVTDRGPRASPLVGHDYHKSVNIIWACMMHNNFLGCFK